MAEPCFHCQEPCPNPPICATIDGESRHFCCHACEAVAQCIDGAGLEQYFSLRKPLNERADQAWLDTDFSAFDRPSFQQRFVTDTEYGKKATLLIEGVHCGACAWLIRQALKRLPGVRAIEVNVANGLASLEFDPDKTPLSELVQTIAQLGYKPHPGFADRIAQLDVSEQRSAMIRLAVSGFGMMQVTSFALAGYFGWFTGIAAQTERFLTLVSMLVATPVVLIAGAPFFRQALAQLKNRRLGMDIPVALAIGMAYAASVLLTFLGRGEVYFDSAVMFIFFLTLARTIQSGVRRSSRTMASGLASLTHPVVRRRRQHQWVSVGVDELAIDDHILVHPGEHVPVDGTLLSDHAAVDESWLTGESQPVSKARNEAVIAGSRVLGDAAAIAVTAVGDDRTLSQLERLYTSAQASRPKGAQKVDTLAAWLVAIILLAAVGGGLFWLINANTATAFSVALATLIVSCPCALSLATPATLSALASGLAKRGLLLLNSDSAERIPQLSHAIFDKTGTLTQGNFRVVEVQTLGPLERDRVTVIAASLEQYAQHPIASAIAELAEPVGVHQYSQTPGQGVSGVIDGKQYRLGSADFCHVNAQNESRVTVFLCDDQQLVAKFVLDDAVREDAAELIQSLKSAGLKTMVLSGDREVVVAELAKSLKLDQFQGGLSPADKQAVVAKLQQQGHKILFVGDGANDAPVLAQADMGIAMGAGTAMAQSGADGILVSNRLSTIRALMEMADKASHILKQNLGWAFAYNMSLIPLAMANFIHPWMAALGMSLSSILVVLNALRARTWKASTS